MDVTRKLIVLSVAALLPMAGFAQEPIAAAGVGANIVEPSEIISLHVNPRSPVAADNLSGSASEPFATAGAAIRIAWQNKVKGIDTKVLLYPGTYREPLLLARRQGEAAQAATPLVIEAMSPGTAVFTESETWQDWEQAGYRRWRHSWPLALASKAERADDPEMLFYQNGPVSKAASRNGMTKWTYFIDENEGKIYLETPAEFPIDFYLLEVAVGDDQPVASLRNVSGVVLRGLVFQHDSWLTESAGAGAVFEDCANLLIENCTFQMNADAGALFRRCRKISIQSCTFTRNRNWGLRLDTCEDVEVSGILAQFNGRNREEGNGDIVNGGVWVGSCENMIFERPRLNENNGHGLKAVGNLGGLMIQNGFFFNNSGAGLLASRSQTRIENGLAAYNGRAGITASETPDFRMSKTIVYHNARGSTPRAERGQVAVSAASRAYVGLTDNIVVSSKYQSAVPLVAVSMRESDGSLLRSEGNLWHHEWRDEKAFEFNGRALDFPRWQEATKNDLGSYYGPPLFMDPQNYDFLPAPESPWYEKSSWPARALR